MALTFAQALLKYRPDQARDGRGRFTDEGGGRGKGSAAALLRAGLDQAKFDRAFEGVSKLPKDKVIAIARQYKNKPTGVDYPYYWGSKQLALRAIRDTFIERSEARDKREIIDRLTGRTPKPKSRSRNGRSAA